MATVLIVIGCVLAPVSVIAVWTANQVSDTGRYIANIEPLIHEPAVQNALTDKVSTAITSHLNVTGLTGQAATQLQDKGLTRLGGLLKSFDPSITSAVDGYIHSTVHKIVTGPRFAQAWIQVNTVAHQALVNALSGRGTTVKVVNGQVTIDLAPFIEIVKQNLASRGFTLVDKLPPIHIQLALFSAKDLTKAQTLYRLINDLKIVLPILSLVLIALGVYIARRHRRALIGAGLGFAASMLVLAIALAIARTIYLNSVPPSVLPSDAASVIYDTFVRFIKTALRTLLVVGLVVAAAAFLSGPSVTAVKTRGAFGSGFSWNPRAGRAAWRVHGAGGGVDVRAPARAADRRGGPVRADLRVLGASHRGGGDPAGRPAAGGARADRADRQAPGAGRSGGDGRSDLTAAGRVRIRPSLPAATPWPGSASLRVRAPLVLG